jgi:ABC-type transport system involved in multi-copper enzyme maturation permease subunit
MTATIAAQMVRADFLKVRKRRGTLIWSLVLALLPLVVYFIVKAAQHSSNPAENGVAGGYEGFHDALRLLALFFGPLAAIMIGTDSGAGDLAAGVFRDLVVTGRSRLALFATRVPAALALTGLIVSAGYLLAMLGTWVFADGRPDPSASLFINGYLFTLLSTGAVCAVAVGFAALTGSRPAALTVLIGWHLIASPLIASISSLGSARKILLSQSIDHFSPVELGMGRHGVEVTMSLGVALLVMVVWLVVFLGLGAWRTKTMDA